MSSIIGQGRIPWRTSRVWSLLAFIAGFVPGFAAADEDRIAFMTTLQRPGVHAIMRHALAPGTGDPSHFSLTDCATQRNLDDRGRAQANAIGTAIREAGVHFDQVRSSEWCRCVDTAALLGLGAVIEDPTLNSFFEDRSTAAEQTQALRDFLSTLPETERVMLVTHQVNITALTGDFVSSGAVFLIAINEEGDVDILDRLEMNP